MLTKNANREPKNKFRIFKFMGISFSIFIYFWTSYF